MYNRDIIFNVPIFAGLDPVTLMPLAARMRPGQHRRGEVIFHRDDPGDRLYIVVQGSVKVSIATEDGREMDLAVIHPGHCFGEMSLLDGSTRSATATTMEATQTLALSREDFLGFLEAHPKVAGSIIALLAQRLRETNETLGDVVFLDVPTRVAKQLLELAGAQDQGQNRQPPLVVPVGQDELARLVGATRETVSRALNSYRRDGILETANRRITIHDVSALEAIASTF